MVSSTEPFTAGSQAMRAVLSSTLRVSRVMPLPATVRLWSMAQSMHS